ncbi:MAG: ABC transporter permease [Acidobacteriota bacterium]|nr:ABC transporter permease [Acidobacteriota bacterium]
MNSYLARKLITLPFVVLAASFLIFAAVRLLPGDPARLMAGIQADQSVVENVRHRLGLDKPFLEQYENFLRDAVHGNLGTSIRSGKPVADEISSRLPYTVALAFSSYAFAILLGLGAGVLAAIFRNTSVDSAIMFFAISGASIANFWLALMAMDLFAVKLGWLPLLGARTPQSYILPTITLGLLPAAVIARMSRASMLEILDQDYMRTARAKGLSNTRVYLKHGLKNALTPIVTIVGMNLAGLLGGAVITETVFSWPGIGRLMVDAVRYRDYAIIQGITLLTVVIVITMNFLADVVIGLIDPRVRFG